jgi:Sigma 54 modulation/S30EA ribosomal protein C terminus
MTAVEIAIGEEVPRGDAEIVRHDAAEFFELLHEPASQALLTVRVKGNHAKQPFVADASVLVGARTIAAHATGRTAIEAADAARDRLRRQLGRIAQNDGRPRMAELEPLPPERVHRPEVALKPPAKRRIVHRRTYLDLPLGTRDAVSDLLDIDAEFMLFVHEKTDEDVVVHVRDDGQIGLLHPPGSELAGESELVIPKASRYPGPLEFRAARREMDFLNHRFLYFMDAADGRGKVIYLRHDGDYGLVEPA